MKRLRFSTVVSAGLLAVVGCVSQPSGGGGSGGAGSGGAGVGTGGSAAGTGGANAGSGGSSAGSGGSGAGTGGSAAGSGGSAAGGGTGGAGVGTGGSVAGSGGSGTGGAIAGTGGSSGSGGSGGAAAGTGGATTGTGGDASAGSSGSACSGAADDPAAAATISGYMNKLPYNNPTGDERTQIIDAIIKACSEFGPPPGTNPGWMMNYCWAHLTAAIEKESSYNATSNVADTYSARAITITGGASETANDPTIGLLQIRFSSTVHDYNQLGALDRLACVGCTFPSTFAAHKNDGGNSDFWAVTGPTANLDLMTNVACNVGLGAWYYYTYATSNGNAAKVNNLSQYCQGTATGANLITGLRSHLEGPDGGKGIVPDAAGVTALMTSDPGAYDYVHQIMTWFDTMVGTVSGTHPFFIPLAPDAIQYCAG